MIIKSEVFINTDVRMIQNNGIFIVAFRIAGFQNRGVDHEINSQQKEVKFLMHVFVSCCMDILQPFK